MNFDLKWNYKQETTNDSLFALIISCPINAYCWNSAIFGDTEL